MSPDTVNCVSKLMLYLLKAAANSPRESDRALEWKTVRKTSLIEFLRVSLRAFRPMEIHPVESQNSRTNKRICSSVACFLCSLSKF